MCFVCPECVFRPTCRVYAFGFDGGGLGGFGYGLGSPGGGFTSPCVFPRGRWICELEMGSSSDEIGGVEVRRELPKRALSGIPPAGIVWGCMFVVVYRTRVSLVSALLFGGLRIGCSFLVYQIFRRVRGHRRFKRTLGRSTASAIGHRLNSALFCSNSTNTVSIPIERIIFAGFPSWPIWSTR